MRARRFRPSWSGRADEGPPDPTAVALVAAVLALLGPAERWAVYTVPGPRDLPDAPQRARDRWWRDHVSAVGGALLLTDPAVDHGAVLRAVELVTTCALARDRGSTDPAEIAAQGVPGAARPPAATPPEPVTTALEVVRWAGRLVAEAPPPDT